MTRRLSPRGASFTLIEVTLGLAILVLIFGVIFQLVQMSVLGADAAAKNSLRNREITGLFALVRQLCLDLPVRSQLSLEPRPAGKGFDLRLENAPLAIFPAKQDGTAVLRFSLQKDPVGRGQRLWLEEISQATEDINRNRPPETNAFELMREITELSWSAFDPRDGQEKTEWNDPVKPAYLRLELTRREGAEERTYMGIFWIPAGYSPGGQPPVDPVTRVPLALTNQTNQG